MPLVSFRRFIRAGLLAEAHAAPLQRLREHNPLLADLVIKRTLASGGARLPAAVFEGRALDTLAAFRRPAR
jgi:mannonate dehydratase